MRNVSGKDNLKDSNVEDINLQYKDESNDERRDNYRNKYLKKYFWKY